MKKLSDYRIKEENGRFVVEGRIEITERRFLRKLVNFEWHGLNVYGEVAGFCHQIDGSNVKIYTTLEGAKEQIIKWCQEPKYYYLREFQGYSYSPDFPKGCPEYQSNAKCVSDKKGEMQKSTTFQILWLKKNSLVLMI